MGKFNVGDKVRVLAGGIYPIGTEVKILIDHGEDYYRIGYHHNDWAGGLYGRDLELVCNLPKFEIGDFVRCISIPQGVYSGAGYGINSAFIINRITQDDTGNIYWGASNGCGVYEFALTKIPKVVDLNLEKVYHAQPLKSSVEKLEPIQVIYKNRIENDLLNR